MSWEIRVLRGTVLGRPMWQPVSRDPPSGALVSCLGKLAIHLSFGRVGRLTIVALGDPVLNAPTLCQIGDLCPVFIWVGVGTECAAVAVTPSRARTAIIRRAMHDSEETIKYSGERE